MPLENPPPDLDISAIQQLQQLQTIALDLDAPTLAKETESLAERVSEGRFFVACVGQFKRGKSSLLNALVGMPVLPTGIIPVTTAPTILRYGPTVTARVQLAGKGWREIPIASLEEYVSEARNPENVRGVEAAEVQLPSPILAHGLCLVDTPGIGSVFANNTTTTTAFVPHIDVALIVIGVDPPIAGDELALIDAVARTTPVLLLVLNKADRFTEAERSSAIAFTRQILTQRLQRPIEHVFEVSATEQLGPESTKHPNRDWDQLVLTLRELARTSGRALVSAAQHRGLIRLIDHCLAEIDAQHDALTRPIMASEARVEALSRAVHDAARRILDLGHLFTAEQRRLGDTFASRRTTFLQDVTPTTQQALDTAIANIPTRWGPRWRAAVLAAARQLARESVEPWLASEQHAAEEAYRTIADRFVTMANDWLVAIAQEGQQEGQDEWEHLPKTIEHDAGFRVPSRYAFREVLPLVYGSPLQTLLDIVRPSSMQQRVIQRDARAYLTALLSMNTTLVQNDLDERITESRQRLTAELQTYLQRVYTLVERALVRARTVHAAGEQAVADAMRKLAEQRERVVRLRDTLTV